jgi:hypothetical protein
MPRLDVMICPTSYSFGGFALVPYDQPGNRQMIKVVAWGITTVDGNDAGGNGNIDLWQITADQPPLGAGTVKPMDNGVYADLSAHAHRSDTTADVDVGRMESHVFNHRFGRIVRTYMVGREPFLRIGYSLHWRLTSFPSSVRAWVQLETTIGA